MYQVREICLPDGRTVNVSDDPSTWPPVGGTDFVPEFAVVPDPRQPRSTDGITDSEDHVQFAKSIKTHGQGMIMKVRLLSDEELIELQETHPRARYRIVDGERRYHATGAGGAGLGVYEITVREYEHPRYVFVEQVVLNTMQKPLNSPDLTRAIVRIHEDFDGLSINKIAEMINVSQGKANDHWHMRLLPPELLDLTNEDKYLKGTRFAIKPAVALAKIKGDPETGKTAHEQQRKKYSEMVNRKITGAVQQTIFFEQFHDDSTRAHKERREPKRKRNRLNAFIRNIIESDLLKMNAEELEHMLSTASAPSRQNLVNKITNVVEELSRFSKELTVASERVDIKLKRADQIKRAASNFKKKNVTGAKANSLSTSEKTNDSMASGESSSEHSGHRKSLSHNSDKGKVGNTNITKELEELVPRPISNNAKEDDKGEKHALAQKVFPFGANFWDDGVSRIVTGKITTPKMFVELWDGNKFEFQQNNKEKPDHIPDISEVKNLL